MKIKDGLVKKGLCFAVILLLITMSTISITAIENKKDSHIVKFIERIKDDNTKRFILTSRTNILNSGILYSSVFANNKIQNNEFMLTIEKLTVFDRARILYNHIWFSKLTEDFIDEYYKLESTGFYNGLVSGSAILSSYFHTHLSKHLSEIRIAPFVHHPTLLAHTPTPTNL